MSRSGLLAATVTALVVVLVGVWLREPQPWEVSDAAAPLGDEREIAQAAEAPTAAQPAPEGELPHIPRDELADRRSLGTSESPEVLARQPTRIDYPLEEEFAGQVWSEVPHELIAAHDGRPEEEKEGPRRLFIAVVDPDLRDADVERLVRDIRARQRDAEVLRIRVFDSRAAALRPSWTDGGAARDAHLVAELFREPGRERLVVRGVEVRL